MVLISALKGKNVSDHYAEYQSAIEQANNATARVSIFRIILESGEITNESLSLFHLLCKKCDSDDLDFLCNLVVQTGKCKDNDDEWILKIIFFALEILKKHNEKFKAKIYNVLKNYENIQNHFLLLLGTPDSVDTCLSIFEIMKNNQLDLLKPIIESIKTENNVFVKNSSSFLTEIAGRKPELFLSCDLNNLLDSENHNLRNCCLEILFQIIMIYKSENKIEQINDMVEILLERFLDVNHYVRARSIQLITYLFEKQSIPIELRNKIFSNVVDRIKDKAVIVRKKAILFCTEAMIKHPFVNHKYLKIEKNIPESMSENQKSYFNDLNIFIGELQKTIKIIKEIYKSLKTETIDILEFMKVAVLLKLDGSFEFMLFLCKNMDKKHLPILFDFLIDIVKVFKEENENDFCDFLLNISENFLRLMNKKHIIEKRFLKSFAMKFENNIDIVKTTDLLKKLAYKRYHGDYFSTASKMLKENESFSTLKAYKNILEIVKIKPTADDVRTAIDNLIDCKIVDFEMIDLTVKIIFRMGDPEIFCKNLLKRLVENKKYLAKTIYIIGSIAINEAFYIDKIEKNVPKINVPDEIKEKRKSFNTTRLSFRQSINYSMNEKEIDLSLNDSFNQPIEIIQEGLKNKTDEEIADILFYIKEKEIFYGKNSLLAPFIKLVVENCKNEYLDAVSYMALYRMMAVSSDFFLKNFSLFLSGLKHINSVIKYNSIIAFGDFILLYNSYVEKYSSSLFDKLFDENKEIVKISLFMIHYLVSAKILKIKGYGAVICKLFTSEHENEIKSLLHAVSVDENSISSVFYEVMLDEEMPSDVLMFLRELVKEKTRENLFLKILRKFNKEERGNNDYLNKLYKSLSFSVKSINEMKMNDVFNNWIENK